MSTDGSFPSRPRQFFEFDPDIASYAVYRLIELLLPPAQNEGRGTVFDE